jgi:serralysin
MDFKSGLDKIDVTAITDSLGLSSGLNFVNAFTGTAGDAVLSKVSGGSSLAIDFSGHGVADFLVHTVGLAATTDIVA